ncbi:MAG: uncharacterized protein JWM67_471 [Mycobacterium sp.]|jgi:hypothetical protein|nr:uncharacterized protein [Mycobacterium sp.]
MADVVTKLGWRLVGSLPAALVANATRKAVTAGWSKATGGAAKDPTDPRTPLRSALAWSLLSGAGVGVVELLVLRRSATIWARATGELPPSLREEES